MKSIIEKIKSRFAKAETPPETDKLINALVKLDELDEFQLFRCWIKCLYADAARDIVNAPSAAVDHIRGRMAAYDQLFQLTSEHGIEILRSEPEMQAKLANLAGNTAINHSTITEDLTY